MGNKLLHVSRKFELSPIQTVMIIDNSCRKFHLSFTTIKYHVEFVHVLTN